MAKSKLKLALQRAQGIDIVREKKKKISQQKPKKKKVAGDNDDSDDEAPELVDTSMMSTEAEEEGGDWESDDDDSEGEKENRKTNGKGPNPAAPASEDEDEDEEEEEEEEEASDVPLSDIESDGDLEVPDILPYQKLTIDNHAALTSLRNRIALPTATLPFSAHQSITSAAPSNIPDIDDDLNRELTFYSQALSAAKEGRRLLKAEKVPIDRPDDYFAEMMKDDEHMGKVKEKLMEEAERKKRSADAKKMRDLKKFGKQVQVQKLQEREKSKKDTLEKIKVLKRKRAGAESTSFEKEADMFDVALDEQTKDNPRGKKRDRDSTDRSQAKRQKKDSKYGFGGKKKFAKSGDALSSGDLSGFSQKKNKTAFGGGGGGKKHKASRPGKSKRQASRR